MKQAFAPYRDKALEDFNVQNESQETAVALIAKYIEHLDDNRLQGRGVTFLGPNGVGKTLLGNIVINQARERDYRVETIEFSTYVSLHKDLFGLQSLIRTGHDNFIDSYIGARQHIRYIQGHLSKSADWVLFDDVGREYASESGWSQNELFDTLRFRWNRRLPTLLTSNRPLADLERRYTEGLASLLKEATEIVMVEGSDYRWKEAS
jgi:DNA replication protein DnaC